MKVIRLKNDEISSLIDAESPEFPKYVKQILNLANQNAQATRPAVVGQMSELIQQFKGEKLAEWEAWYLQHYPAAISEASKKIRDMVQELKKAMEKIDEQMIEKWVKDLVIVKTFIGLKFQEVILRKIASELQLPYRMASPVEESKGIDGYIGSYAVSIKPMSYTAMASLPEEIPYPVLYYRKTKDGLEIQFDESRWVRNT